MSPEFKPIEGGTGGIQPPGTLPERPPGRSGWPWECPIDPLPATMPDGAAWPKITVVTPSYNQGQFIEQTIRSVLGQGYPNLEYVVMDGASTDQTVEIIRKYERHLTYWRSDRDKGQSDAIQKGFSKSTGKIGYYVNSDDWMLPGSLARAAERLESHPGRRWMCSPCLTADAEGRILDRLWPANPSVSFARFVCRMPIPQPGVFWKTGLFEHIQFNPAYVYCMDHAFFCEVFHLDGPPLVEAEPSAVFRVHGDSKSARLQETLRKEAIRVAEDWLRRLPLDERVPLAYLWQEMFAAKRMRSAAECLSEGRLPEHIWSLLGKAMLYPRSLRGQGIGKGLKKYISRRR